MDFAQLGLPPVLARRCASLGYTAPTPIQQQAIPLMLRGADVLGCAATGTGKTAAFLLPLIHRLSATPGPGVRALILAPTRELASQIAAHLHAFDATKGVRAMTVIGGASTGQQVEGLRRPPPVVIATPGACSTISRIAASRSPNCASASSTLPRFEAKIGSHRFGSPPATRVASRQPPAVNANNSRGVADASAVATR